MIEPKSSPIVLYSGLIALTAAGEVATVDPNVMKNQTDKPMWIDEVRFTFPGPLTIVATGDFGSYIWTRMRVGRQYVTPPDYVPIWLLSKIRNYGGSYQFTYIYKPPKPILVPVGENLQCDLIVNPKVRALGAIAIHSPIAVTYAGRTIAEDDFNRIEMVDVPWVAKFCPDPFVQGKLTNNIRSGQNDLVGPFAEELKVSSMIGRVGVSGADAYLLQPCVPAELVTLTLKNVNGAIIIRDPTPFGNIFDSINREFLIDTVIDRKSYFIASISADLRDMNDGGGTFTNIPVHMALHGYRTVPRAEYMR